ncbi:MAG: hypothetical protein WAR79_00045 [Melioribacteraceae bacterium]
MLTIKLRIPNKNNEPMEILTSILLISASALCIAMIYFFHQIVKSVHLINENIQEFSIKLEPIIESTRELLEKLNPIVNEVESQFKISKSICRDLRERTDKILNLETKIRYGIEDTVIPFLNSFHNIVKGVKSFWRNYRNK